MVQIQKANKIIIAGCCQVDGLYTRRLYSRQERNCYVKAEKIEPTDRKQRFDFKCLQALGILIISSVSCVICGLKLLN